MTGHDIIVVGASAGGVEALIVLAAGLPADFPGSVFVVIHVPANAPSVLPMILSRRGPLPATAATDGERIEPGRIYVSQPDHHLLVRNGHVHLAKGPRENGHRPAVDPLFRTAALTYGPRVVGVVLSGNLDDGSAGLSTIKTRGGIAIVQDPAEALYPDMPRNAIRNVQVDEVLPVAEIPAALTRLARQPAKSTIEPTMQSGSQRDMRKEAQMSELVPAAVHDADRPGVASGFACPECGGALFELEEDEFTRYRCRVGHAFSPDTLLAEQSDSVENSMWTALRALEESAALCQRLARRATGSDASALRDRYTAQARESLQHAENIRTWLVSSFPGRRGPSAAGSKESHGPHPAPNQAGTAKRPQEA